MNEELLKRVEILERENQELQEWKRSLESVETIPYEQVEAIKARFPQFLFGKVTFDTPSVNGAASTTIDVMVFGAALGDLVVMGLPTALMGTGRLFTPYVSAQNIVTIQFDNQTAGAIDLGSADFYVVVIKQP